MIAEFEKKKTVEVVKEIDNTRVLTMFYTLGSWIRTWKWKVEIVNSVDSKWNCNLKNYWS